MTTDTVKLTDEQEGVIAEAARVIAPVFQAMDWGYGWERKIPDEEALRKTITSLVEYVLSDEDDDIVRVSSGRITVLRDRDEASGEFDVEIKLDIGAFTVEPPEESVLDRVRRIAENAERHGFDSPELAEIRRLLAEVS